jgi:hypothetical protein
MGAKQKEKQGWKHPFLIFSLKYFSLQLTSGIQQEGS